MPASTAKPVPVKLEEEMRNRIKSLADARDRTTHWLMREAIQQYVEREEKREAFRQEGIRAWNEYQATGLHLTSGEADAWLGQLESGQDAEPPECHV
ncbi:MAG: ribbon-helix-helix protein, CopG family [Betaproteobacteria bacterium]|nr:ribbon-helix-helix protein, CopG family [Betaproteobacteria bacterium]